MANQVTTSNLTMGPGDLYKGDYDAVEPLDAAVNIAPAASAWNGMGGTDGGVKLIVKETWEELKVDQIIEIPERRRTKREWELETKLAETTLDNLAAAVNESPPVTGSGYKSLELSGDNSATQPNYYALIFDGYAPAGLRRRVIARKVLSIDGIETEAAKTDQTFFKVKFAAHYVSASIKAVKVVDQTS